MVCSSETEWCKATSKIAQPLQNNLDPISKDNYNLYTHIVVVKKKKKSEEMRCDGQKCEKREKMGHGEKWFSGWKRRVVAGE